MEPKPIPAGLALLLLGLMAVSATLRLRPAAGAAPRGGDPVPPFSVRTLDGERWDSRSLRGRRYGLLFLSRDCPYCRRCLAPLARGLRDSPEALVLVASDHPSVWPSDAVFRHLDDSSAGLRKIFRVRIVPTLYLIDEAGRIEGGYSGLRNEAFYLRQVPAFLAGKERLR